MAEKPEEVVEAPSSTKKSPCLWSIAKEPLKPPRHEAEAYDYFLHPMGDSSSISTQSMDSEVPGQVGPNLNNRTNTGISDGNTIEIQGILNVLEDHGTDFDRDQFFENFRRRLRELDLLEDELFDLDDEIPAENHAPLYPVGETKSANCEICLEWKSLTLRPCCDLPVCADCLSCYLNTQVSQAIVKIECLSNACDHYIHREEIVAVLDPENREKFYRFLVDANKEPHIKTCPRCSHISSVDPESVKAFKQQKYGLKVTCPACELDWCFPCQSPWHEAVTCRDFQRGDKLLNTWAKEHHYGQANAQKCPKCRIFIQRSSGCDHMTCTKCKTDFCYRCGERFLEIRFIGDHYSKLSIFGCKYRFKPDQPAQRRLIRGAIFGSKLVAAPIVAGLAVGAGAVLLGFGALALPFYGSYKLHRRITKKKRWKREKQEAAEWKREMLRRGDPYLENWVHMQELGLDMSGMYRSRPVVSRGHELDISCPMTNADNLAELEASMHSDTDSWDTWETESEAEQVKVTQVKVITEQYERFLLRGSRDAKNCSADCDDSDGDVSDDVGDDKNGCPKTVIDVADLKSDQTSQEFPPPHATLAMPEQLSTWSEGNSDISADDFSTTTGEGGVATANEPTEQEDTKTMQEEDIWKSATDNDVVREIRVVRESDGERTMCIYHL